MYVVLTDNDVIETSGGRDLVEKMMFGSSMIPGGMTLNEYMKMYSESIKDAFGSIIRYDTPENFSTDIFKNRIVWEISPAKLKFFNRLQ